MSKELEALEKINHTIYLNTNEQTLKFGLDDLDHIDCKDIYEFVDCYNAIKSALIQFEKLKRALIIIEAQVTEEELLKEVFGR